MKIRFTARMRSGSIDQFVSELVEFSQQRRTLDRILQDLSRRVRKDDYEGTPENARMFGELSRQIERLDRRVLRATTPLTKYLPELKRLSSKLERAERQVMECQSNCAPGDRLVSLRKLALQAVRGLDETYSVEPDHVHTMEDSFDECTYLLDELRRVVRKQELSAKDMKDLQILFQDWLAFLRAINEGQRIADIFSWGEIAQGFSERMQELLLRLDPGAEAVVQRFRGRD